MTILLAGFLAAAPAGCAVGGPRPISGATGDETASSDGQQLLIEPGAIVPIYSAIRAARTSIEITMYELEDPIAERALVAAAHRGVRVRVLLNGGQTKAANVDAADYLRAHGVPVHWAPSYVAMTHQKTMTIDGRRSLVMTLNLTARYYASTRDFALWDLLPADVAAIQSVFEADWNKRAVTPSAGTGDLVWSPGAQSSLLRLIGDARASVEVENEEMADRPIMAALCRAAQRHIDVRIVMTDEVRWASAFSTLTRCGAAVRVHHGEKPLYIHAKAIVVDGVRAYLGSQNFSYASLERNRELGLITTSATVVRALHRTFARDYREGAAVQQRPAASARPGHVNWASPGA